MTGTKGHSGRKRSATAQRNGRVYVALDEVLTLTTINNFEFDRAASSIWYVDMRRFTDYADAAAEFVRRVNAK